MKIIFAQMLGLPDMSNAKRVGAFKFDLMVCVLNQ
jgi:hypothetical protein